MVLFVHVQTKSKQARLPQPMIAWESVFLLVLKQMGMAITGIPMVALAYVSLYVLARRVHSEQACIHIYIYNVLSCTSCERLMYA